jgi:CDP-glucose 4,6-dehydratase
MSFSNQYAGRRVLVTGHTGFKGSWLCEWLTLLGADVFGYALPAEEGALFTQIELAARIHHQEADIRDLATLCAVVKSSRPDLIFHLAAQNEVPYSMDHHYEDQEANIKNASF